MLRALTTSWFRGSDLRHALELVCEEAKLEAWTIAARSVKYRVNSGIVVPCARLKIPPNLPRRPL
jgi:hypothetical protein